MGALQYGYASEFSVIGHVRNFFHKRGMYDVVDAAVVVVDVVVVAAAVAVVVVAVAVVGVGVAVVGVVVVVAWKLSSDGLLLG